MISYHRRKPDLLHANDEAKYYRKSWETADLDDVERLSRGIAKFCWSGVIWHGGMRSEKNFKEASWFVLDFDDFDHGMTLKQAIKGFCDRIHIIGTTKSHGISGDRFRVAIKSSEVMHDLALYRHNYQRLVKHFGTDKSCVDGARFFWPCKEIVSFSQEGEVEEVDHDVPKPKLEAYIKGQREARIINPWTRQSLNRVIPIGERNTAVFRISKDLASVGMTPEKIFSAIVNSKTYGGIYDSKLEKEILYTMNQGFKSLAVEDEKYGRRVENEEGSQKS